MFHHVNARKLLALGATVGIAATTLVPQVAAAAAPANDEVGGAIALSVPDLFVQDTTEATTSPDEASLNDFCGAPRFDHAVWFTVTPTDSGTVAVDVSASDYAAGILVVQGAPGAFEPLLCGPGTVAGFAEAGVTYHIVVFGDGLSPETSGTLVVETFIPPPPPVIDLTVDPVASVDRSGAAHLSGTVTCTSEDENAFVFEVSGQLRQKVGRFIINGYFFSELFAPCDGATRTWRAAVVGDNGVFAGGKAATVVFSFGCGSFECTSAYVEADVRLRRNGR